MNTVSVWKRSMAIFLAALMVVGMIPLTQMMATETYAASPSVLYLKPSSNWKEAGAWFAAYFFDNGEKWVKMTDSDGDGVYEVNVPSGFPSVIFCRMNPASTAMVWSNRWSQTGDLSIPTDGKNCYTVSGWDGGSWGTYSPASTEVNYYVAGTANLCGSEWNASDTNNKMTKQSDGTYTITYSNREKGDYAFKVTNGTWDKAWPGDNKTFSLTEKSNVTITFNPKTEAVDVKTTPVGDYNRQNVINLDSDKVFYVPVDIVDYLNDNRVANNQVNGYYTDNQGEPDFGGTSQYSYLNHLISAQAYYGNFDYPMYFGPLYYISARYSKEVGSTAYKSLGKWSSAANVAIADSNGALNTDAVVQGLLSDYKLDANGNLVHKTAKDEDGNPIPFLYFSETAANQWTNNGSKVMAYYSDLQFPFVMNYDEDTRVTTYSYDSANDYAVYYDYENSKLYASSKHVLDSTADDDKSSTDYGFYPLNEPDDSGNEVNNGFGVKFTIDFTVGENGKLADGSDVTFNFTGDDDVWVFIDGVLVLDMGGAHAKASGHINFAKKTAVVDDAASVSGGAVINSGNTWENIYSGDNSYLYDNNTVERARLSNGIDSKTFSDLGLDFKYDEIHTMTVFYMERGMLESNFSMDFTMVPVPSGLTVSKDLNDSEINAGILDEVSAAEDYDFTISATSPSSTSIAFPNYSLTEKNTGLTAGKTTKVTINGNTYTALISGVTNDTYAHSFVTDKGDDAFIPGTVFTITESTKDIFSYSGTRWAIYDANNGYANITNQVKNTGANVSSKTASFTMGNVNDVTAFSYAVSFVNTMNLGTLQVKKVFSDEVLGDTKFTFKVYLDLDGEKAAFSEAMYPGLVYTVEGVTHTSTDGSIQLKGGQTAVISGIPANATYRVEEVTSQNDSWQLQSSSNTTGIIPTGGTATATFTNVIKSVTSDKVIYVEAGKPTNYTVKYNGQNVTLSSITPVTGLTATKNGSVVTVTGAQADQAYTMGYVGRLSDGEAVSGTITVYTFAAVDKTYVFDFGLRSDLAALTGSGLFQNNKLFNSKANTSAVLSALTGGNGQTTITITKNASISSNGASSAVIFTPVAFMSQVETYTYTVTITAANKTFNANDPETGCVVTGTIKVMPANSVYYEDNFNVTDKDDKPAQEIIFSANTPTVAPSLTQNNDQSTNYGYDSVYNGGYAQSNGSSTVLNHLDYAYFTFTGTGFDLISETKAESAGMAVYVFEGVFNTDHLEYVTDHTDTTQTPKEMVFVNNYYANGNLYQVPVVSVRGLTTGTTYTVYIQSLSTSYGSSVTIDGVRIYNPLSDTKDYLSSEQGTKIDELRVLYGTDKIVSFAVRNGNTVAGGFGKYSIVENATGGKYTTAQELMDVYKSGPNNEMYLPAQCGIKFTYKVNSSDWTLQIGAKAVTATNAAKSFGVYARTGTNAYTFVGTVDLKSTTDMYYDLTGMLTTKGFGNAGTYDLIIVSNCDRDNPNEFVSLTTVKHKGIAFQANN